MYEHNYRFSILGENEANITSGIFRSEETENTSTW